MFFFILFLNLPSLGMKMNMNVQLVLKHVKDIILQRFVKYECPFLVENCNI